ncbi:FMN-dependent NADH-azoreductase [Clostridium bovifaecis]|uniref:FMN dependent NADH:quinone oxidoreductase n=1 Tax=Clostridium bovifaecis TaxID=2184719 RepID=A0A6I6EYM2_9CLOT|nr:FMN-dependent NADH-azoreductase [Clostridium bovifaecis]
MSKLLYIKANPKPDNVSRTFRISEEFIKGYKEKNPQDEVITLDLYKENIHHLTLEDINDIFSQKGDDAQSHPILKYAYEFASADKYVIAAPLWNLSIPAILKSYIDYISVTGITFKYTENGPVGLCHGKKAMHIVARGGSYGVEPLSSYEMGDRYLRTIFGFLGITDFTTVAAENLDVIGADVEGIVQKAIKEAKEVAQNF